MPDLMKIGKLSESQIKSISRFRRAQIYVSIGLANNMSLSSWGNEGTHTWVI